MKNLTSDYREQFREKVRQRKLCKEDLVHLRKTGFLEDTELYNELIDKCERNRNSDIYDLRIALRDYPATAAEVLASLLDDTTFYILLRKLGVIYV